jgi:hypothetical protein
MNGAISEFIDWLRQTEMGVIAPLPRSYTACCPHRTSFDYPPGLWA